MAVTLWHNPRCSKSRAALTLLEQAGQVVDVRLYLQDVPTVTELMEVQQKLGCPAADMVRWKDVRQAKAGGQDALDHGSDAVTIFSALAAQPKWIERPIGLTQTAARIGRPPEAILEIL
ncbi:hypothetical protein BFP70_04840 [Thioclava sp. SK-1]|uniref:ArsC/Spx/MgsR family protein n=1 Tax=Thioclava sp. SK-1 TaxID=1889770 RepID=UPI0008256C56|nr:ArsC/Spx/MgsR family protein [Thioclava sp. SK-1]OCX66550.1 hypothetical protein BFP70_04840 [Thioclava sp. SK-1]